MQKNLMKNMIRMAATIFVAGCNFGDVEAHDVEWYQMWKHYYDTNYPMVLVYGRDWWGDKDWDEIGILPAFGEPCTVVVNITSVSSPVISAHFENGINTANAVWIEVDVEGSGPTQTVATVSGEWHATGLDTNGVPQPVECDATSPHPFSVPVVVESPITWAFHNLPYSIPRSLMLDTGNTNGHPSTLLQSETLINPMWMNVGVGTQFTLKASCGSKFFTAGKRLTASLSGSISDPLGNPLSGLSIGLPYGGPSTTSGYDGSFTLPWLPPGLNWLAIREPIMYVDPANGSNRTENVGVNVVVPATNHMASAQLKVDIGVTAGSGSNNCDCTPWCAIETGALNGTQMPVYYAGGVLPPTTGPADCRPQVTVIPPVGAAYSITPGEDLDQNSGPNPASGTWTITTTVCGRSKSCTVTVP